jgi:hypothetical protein
VASRVRQKGFMGSRSASVNGKSGLCGASLGTYTPFRRLSVRNLITSWELKKLIPNNSLTPLSENSSELSPESGASSSSGLSRPSKH